MGKILKIDNTDETNPVITLKTSKEELNALKGNLNRVHIFSTMENSLKTNIAPRGSKESTVYLRIPKQFRSKLKKNGRITRVELNNKIIFGVEIDKEE
ncbi:hypothetical protein JXB41_06960 [Candidatus Woesearchaeota archaeon]|nr:hypothetical protein [Candidatus Woesearchaeota archaeon]